MLKKTLLVIATLAGAGLLAATPAANAALPGFYVGGQVGWGDTHYSNSTIGVTSSSLDTKGIAGRLFTGYQFDQNWAAELGYTRFSNTKYKNVNNTGINLSVKQYAVDLVGKGILPLQNGFSLYGKAGAAYVDADLSLSGFSLDEEHKIYPIFGAGVSYDITPNVPVDLSWNRIQKIGNGDIPSSDFVSLGIAYNFG